MTIASDFAAKAPLRRPVPLLLMVREMNHGGVERDVAKLATHLDPSRFTTHVATYSPRGMRYEELRAAGVPVLSLPVESVFSVQAARAALRLRGFLRDRAIRVVHAYDPSGILGVPVARLAGVPVVLSSQLSYRALCDPHTLRLLRYTDRISHAVFVNCEAIRRHLIDDERVPAGKVVVAYNGVDPNEFHPAEGPRPEQLSNASLTIGTVCVLRPEKALHLLLEAFARVRRPGIRLAIVGSGPELPRLQAMAGELGIAGDCHFEPSTREVPRWLRALDIFVLCSMSEAFSNALLEAMACGCAVVGSRLGGTPEMIGAGEERGLLFESGNAADLADRLSRLIESEEMRRDLSDRASRHALEHLSMAAAARRMAEIYDDLLLRASDGKQKK